jgi:hypothetical protein
MKKYIGKAVNYLYDIAAYGIDSLMKVDGIANYFNPQNEL